MAKRASIVSEFMMFMKAHKAYWMIPIIVVLMLLAAMIFLGSTGAAPFIYTLF